MGFRSPRRTDPPPKGPRATARRDSRDRSRDRHREANPHSRWDYPSNTYRPEYDTPRRSSDLQDSPRSPVLTSNRQSSTIVNPSTTSRNPRDELSRRETNSIAVRQNAVAVGVHPDRIPMLDTSATSMPGLQMTGSMIGSMAGSKGQILPATPIESPREMEITPAVPTGPNPIPTSGHSEDPEVFLAMVNNEIAQEAAELARLKSNLERAKRTVAQRNAEYQQSARNFVKYPDVKTACEKSIHQAEKSKNSVEISIAKQEVKIVELHSKTAKQSIPFIMSQAQGGSLDMQRKINEVTETCTSLRKLIEQQQDVIKEFQNDRKAFRATEEKLSTKVQALEDQIQKILPLQESKINEYIIPMKDDLNARFTSANEKLGKATLKIEKQGQDIGALSGRTANISKIQEDIKKLAAEGARVVELPTRVMDLQKRVDLLELPKKINDGQPELETSLKDIKSRLKSLERATQRTSPDIATKKDIQALQGRLKGLETTPPPKSAPVQLSDSVTASLRHRLDNLEKQLGDGANDAQSMKSIEDELKALSDRIGTFTEIFMEPKDPNAINPDPKDPQAWRNYKLEGSMAVEIEQLKAQIEDCTGRVTMTQNLLGTTVAGMATSITTNIKAELQTALTGIRQEIDNVWRAQDESKNVVNGLLKSTNGLGDRMAKNLDTKFTALETRVKGLEFKVATDSREQDVESKVATIRKEIAEGLNQNVQAWQQNMQQSMHQNMLQPIKKVTDDIQGIQHTIANITARLDSINTNDLAQNMLAQIGQVFPNLSQTEATIRTLRSLVDGLSERIGQTNSVNSAAEIADMKIEIRTLEEKIRNVSTFAQQTAISEASTKCAALKTELQDQLDHAAKNVEELKTAVHDRMEGLPGPKDFQTLRADLQSESAKSLEELRTNLQGQLNHNGKFSKNLGVNLQGQITRDRKVVEELKTHLQSQITDSAKTTEENLTDVQGQLDTHVKTTENLCTRVDDLHNKNVEDLTDKLVESEEKAAELAKATEEVTSRLTKRVDELDVNQTQRARLQREVTTLSEKVNGLETQVSRLEKIPTDKVVLQKTPVSRIVPMSTVPPPQRFPSPSMRGGAGSKPAVNTPIRRDSNTPAHKESNGNGHPNGATALNRPKPGSTASSLVQVKKQSTSASATPPASNHVRSHKRKNPLGSSTLNGGSKKKSKPNRKTIKDSEEEDDVELDADGGEEIGEPQMGDDEDPTPANGIIDLVSDED